MEYIYILLFLVPLLFKGVAKHLEKSGDDVAAQKLRKLAEMLSEDDDKKRDKVEDNDFNDERIKEVFPTYSFELMEEGPSEVRDVVLDGVNGYENSVSETSFDAHSIKSYLSKKGPAMVEDDNLNDREKIDPKKLIIYSEIMNPKF